jgi:hypothetical protein
VSKADSDNIHFREGFYSHLLGRRRGAGSKGNNLTIRIISTQRQADALRKGQETDGG